MKKLAYLSNYGTVIAIKQHHDEKMFGVFDIFYFSGVHIQIITFGTLPYRLYIGPPIHPFKFIYKTIAVQVYCRSNFLLQNFKELSNSLIYKHFPKGVFSSKSSFPSILPSGFLVILSLPLPKKMIQPL